MVEVRIKVQAREWLLSAAIAISGAAQAAGGHHAVDDAAILQSGTCEVESWLSRARGERSLHAGAGCRLGPVELGVATDYARPGGGSQTGYGLQAKWAREVAAGLSAGVSVSPGWQAHVRPRFQGTTVAGLVTWAARENIALHLNLGRDLVHGGPDQGRSGVSLEWAPREGWSIVGERYYEGRSHFARAGVRWAAIESLSLDFSRAQRLRGAAQSNWTLGLTWMIGAK